MATAGERHPLTLAFLGPEHKDYILERRLMHEPPSVADDIWAVCSDIYAARSFSALSGSYLTRGVFFFFFFFFLKRGVIF